MRVSPRPCALENRSRLRPWTAQEASSMWCRSHPPNTRESALTSAFLCDRRTLAHLWLGRPMPSTSAILHAGLVMPPKVPPSRSAGRPRLRCGRAPVVVLTPRLRPRCVRPGRGRRLDGAPLASASSRRSASPPPSASAPVRGSGRGKRGPPPGRPPPPARGRSRRRALAAAPPLRRRGATR